MLEGTLDSFTLPDVFQLLAFTKKSGALELRHDRDTGQVFFSDGQVTYALSSTGRMALGRRMVGAGLVDTETLAEALDEQKKARQDGKGLRLGQILLDRGVIDQATLEDFVREQIQDSVFDLMRWPDGAFRFDAGEGLGEEQPIQLAVSVENLIMEGSRRLEEWDAVRKKVPSMAGVVAMAPLPGDSGVEVSLRPEEWRLLTLVDGRRTVRDLVELFGQGEFATCKVLYGLVGAGLLEIRDPELEGPPSIAALLAQQELLRELEDDADVSLDDQVPSRPAPRAPAAEAAPEPVEEPAPEPVDEPVGEPAGVETAAGDVAETARHEEPPAADERGDVSDVSDVAEEPSPNGEGPAERLTTDPSIDSDLVQRLIEGVKGL